MKYQDDTLEEVLAEMAEVWVRAGRGEIFEGIPARGEPSVAGLGRGLKEAIDRELSRKRESP